MLVVTKFTLNYDKEQDRISLTARCAEKEVILLWLTQRLLNRLVQELIRWLDDELTAVVSSNTVQEFKAAGQHAAQLSPGSATPVNAKIIPELHAFEQSAALSAHKPEKPVKADTPLEDYLLKSIDLTRLPKGYRIVFKWGGDDAAAKLVMDTLQLRQFMGMLYHVVGQANWPRHAWPAWLASEPARAELAAPPVVLH